MNLSSTIIESFRIKLSHKDKKVLKKLIYIFAIFLFFLIIYYGLVFAYISYDKFILPALKSKMESD